MADRVTIYGGQSRHTAYATPYRFVKWLGDGEAVFQEGNSEPEVYVARPYGVSGYALYWRGTSWEFCHTYKDAS